MYNVSQWQEALHGRIVDLLHCARMFWLHMREHEVKQISALTREMSGRSKTQAVKKPASIYFNCQLPNSCTPFIMVDYLITLMTTLLRLHQSTKVASLQKYYLPRMKTSLGQFSLKYIGPKIWSNIPETLKSSSSYSFGKIYKKFLLSCQNSCWSSFYMLVTFCNTALMPLISLLSTSIVTLPTPCT